MSKLLETEAIEFSGWVFRCPHASCEKDNHINAEDVGYHFIPGDECERVCEHCGVLCLVLFE